MRLPLYEHSMPERATIEVVRTRLEAGVAPPLVAIDGLPCAGKSTLVSRLYEDVDFEYICLDEFVRPEKDWPSGIKPAFPFEFIRYGEFLDTVRTLASFGTCTYQPFDFDTFAVSAETKTVGLSELVVVDGVSSLHPSLCDLYGLKIFIESTTTLQAALDRGAAASPWARQWRELFLPSVDIYMETSRRSGQTCWSRDVGCDTVGPRVVYVPSNALPGKTVQKTSAGRGAKEAAAAGQTSKAKINSADYSGCFQPLQCASSCRATPGSSTRMIKHRPAAK
jgi:hypothetical protein